MIKNKWKAPRLNQLICKLTADSDKTIFGDEASGFALYLS